MAWADKRGYVYDYVVVDNVKKAKCFGHFERAKERNDMIRDLDEKRSRNKGIQVDYSATIWQFCDRYVDLPKPRAENTIRIINNAIEKIKAYFPKDYKLVGLEGNEDAMQDFVKYLLTKFNHTTTHMHMRNFRGILNMAVKKRILEANPANASIKLLGKPRGREVYLTADQKEALYAAAMKVKLRAPNANTERKAHPAFNIELVNVIKVFLNTGVRRAELINMAKEHMISDCEIIIPSQSDEGQSHLIQTKSDNPYVVSLNSAIQPIFAAVKSGQIFKGWTVDNVETRFRLAADLAGLPKLTPHGLRHTFASDFLKSGRKLEELQKALNHSSIDMTLKYAHLEKGRMKEAMEAIVVQAPAQLAVI